MEQETKAVVATETKAVAAVLQPSETVKNAFLEVQENFESMDNMQVPKIKVGPAGFTLADGERPVESIEGVIIHTRMINQYYDKPFNPQDIQPPTCFSLDGKTPDPSSEHIQAPKCAGCPKAEFGSNNQGKGKACRNMKPIYVLCGDESIIPRQLTIAPTSLKAANQFMMGLAERGLNYAGVKVKITAYNKSGNDTYSTLKFENMGKLDPVRREDVKFLKQNWLPHMNKASVEREASDEAPAQAAPTEAPQGDY